MSDVLVWGAAVAVASSAGAICVVAINRYQPRWMAARGNAMCVVAVVAGAILGHVVLRLWPHWPPANALDRFLVIALPATVALLLIGQWLSKSRGLQWALYFFLALCLGRILLHRSVYLQDDGVGSSVVLVSSAGLLIGVQNLLTRLWVRTRQASIPFAIAAALFTAGLLVLMAGYIKGGCAALPWSAAVAGATFGACLTRNRANLQGVIGLAVVVLFGILFIGRFFGGLTTECVLLVLLTPLICWVPELPVIRTRAPWQKECLCLSLVAAALFAILLPAKRKFDGEMAPLLTEVREAVDPPDQTNDVQNAIHWVQAEPWCEANCIGLRGSSFSGVNVVYSAERDPRIKALVSQVPPQQQR
jgi:hypothetical protein